MGKRARGKRGRSAVSKQLRWDHLTLKHVEKFIKNVIQDREKQYMGAEGNYWEETLLQADDWIRNDLMSCYFDDDGIHALPTSPLARLPRQILEIAYAHADHNIRDWGLRVVESQSAAEPAVAAMAASLSPESLAHAWPDSWQYADEGTCGSEPSAAEPAVVAVAAPPSPVSESIAKLSSIAAAGEASLRPIWDSWEFEAEVAAAAFRTVESAVVPLASSSVISAAVASAVDALASSSVVSAAVAPAAEVSAAVASDVDASQICPVVWSRDTSGIGLNKQTTPDKMAEDMDRWQRKVEDKSKLLALPASSSSEDEQPAPGEILNRLHQAKKEHVESQCTSESRCEHAVQLLALWPRIRQASASFEYDPRCCGDSWTIHVLQCGTELTKGRLAEATLLKKYGVDVRKMKEHPLCDASYVQTTMAQFLQTRGISFGHLGPVKDRGDSWFSFALRQEAPYWKSNWVETGFHAFPLECLASIVKHGLLPSSPDRPGCRFQDKPGLYLLKSRLHSASSYSRFVADSAGIFFRFTMECIVDRNQLLPCKRKGQWLQPVGSWATVALWVQAVPYEDIAQAECIMPAWIPLLEVPA